MYVHATQQRWAPTMTLRALNTFSETLYEECSFDCVQKWYCTVHFVYTGNCLLQKLDFFIDKLHMQNKILTFFHS